MEGNPPTSGSEHAPGSAPLVQRPRLLDLVEQGTENQLTLISAPAGSGKTVLLRAWMAATAQREPIAHVALAREHADRRTFWLDVLAAAGRARPELRGVAVPAGGAGSFAPLKTALDELDEPLLLVLDDLHQVGADEVPADLEWLLEHVPTGFGWWWPRAATRRCGFSASGSPAR